MLTALMPVRYFDPGYLEEALRSLASQTSSDWRLIVIVDADDPAELLDFLGPWGADDRIRVVPNQGARLAAAINTGMRLATTEFVALLFADDLWDIQAVETLTARIAADTHVDFFHSARRFVDDEGRAISGVYAPRHDITMNDFVEGAPVKHLLCWRREMGLAIGGLDETSRSVGPDDFDFPWTMAERGARFGAIDECLYIYRDHRRVERLTTHLSKRVHARELRRIFRKHGLSRRAAARRVAFARATYLKQCLYRTDAEGAFRRRFRRPPAIWRESYRL